MLERRLGARDIPWAHAPAASSANVVPMKLRHGNVVRFPVRGRGMSRPRFTLDDIVRAADLVYAMASHELADRKGWQHVEQWQVVAFVARRMTGASFTAIATRLAYNGAPEAVLADRSIAIRPPGDAALRERVARVIGRLIVDDAAAALLPLPTPPAPIPLLQQVTQ